MSRVARRFYRLTPPCYNSGLSLRSSGVQVCFRHWRALALLVGGSYFRSGSMALWRYLASASAPAPYWLARGRRLGGNASAVPSRFRASPKPPLRSGFGDALPLPGNALRSARAQRRALLRAVRQGWGLFLRGASAACSVFSVSPSLPLRRYAFAYTCGRRFRSWVGSPWSPSHDLTIRSAPSLA